ncbi:MAG: acyltransferase [Cocleimonas sp.]
MVKKRTKERLYEIDLLRFLAAIAVLFYHYTFAGYADHPSLVPVEFPVLAKYTRYSYLGVNLFFLISGFVILLSAMNRSATDFASSRFIRLYPAFWASVSLSALVLYFYGSPHFDISLSQYLMNMTMVSGYVGVKPIDGVYWTLLIEMVFYSLIFFLLFIRKLKYIELFLGLWLGVILLSLVMTLPKIIRFFFFPEWAPLFISGSLLYLIYARGWDLTRSLLLFSAYLLTLYFTTLETNDLTNQYNTEFSSIIAIFGVSSFYGFFILIITNKTAWLRSRKFISLGLLTYPLYLFHANIGYLAFKYYSGTINKYLLLIAVILVMLLLAWLVHHVIEKPLSRYLQRKYHQLQDSPSEFKKAFQQKHT